MTDETLEDYFEAYLAEAYQQISNNYPTPGWLDALAMRAGTRGPVATLDEAGDVADVTRERMRQVMAKVELVIAGDRLVPRLRDIAQTLVDRSPVPEPIGRMLSRAGKTRATLTGAGLLSVMRLLGTCPRELVGTDLVSVDDWLVDESDVPVMKAVRMARKHTSKYGMTTVEDIRQALSTDEKALEPLGILRVLRSDASVKWTGDWLWVEKDTDGPHANRLVNVARSILSVNSPQTVSSIREGARRMWKFRHLDILAPVDAMKHFFEQTPFFIINGDLVLPTEPLDYREIQGDVTATMIDVLKSSPYQVMDRQSLQEACEEAGVAPGTYGVWTTYAEWMDKFGPNVWGLRGSNPNPGAVEEIRRAALARTKAEPRRKVWSWAPDGSAVQTMDVTTSILSTGVLSFRSSIHNLIAGQSLAVTVDGTPVGTVKLGIDHSFCWGWFPVLAALGAKKGDVLQIRVDVGGRSASVRTGGQELWD